MKGINLLALVAFACSLSNVTAEPWRSEGPTGGYFVHFVGHPTEPNVIWAGGDDSSGIWKSENGGISWRLVSEELTNVTGWWLEIDPVDPDVLYGADIYGRHPLIKSVDGGERWQEVGSGLSSRRTNSVAVDPGDPRRVFVATGDGERGGGDGVFRSIDGGLSFEPAGLEGRVVTHLEMTPTGVLFGAAQDGTWRSLDGGVTWAAIEGDPTGGASAIHVGDSGTVYVARWGLRDGIWASVDDGESWISAGFGMRAVWDLLEIPSRRGSELLAATLLDGTGIWRSAAGQRAWIKSNGGLPTAWNIGLGAAADGSLFTSNFCNEGIFRSTDGGRSWAPAAEGLHAYYATGLAFAPSDPSISLVTALGSYNAAEETYAERTFKGRVTERGIVWTALPLAAQTYSPTFSPVDADVFILGTWEQGFFLTTDGGETFTQPHDENTALGIAFDPDAPRRAWVNTWDIETARAALWQTNDGGETWSQESVPFIAAMLLSEAGSPRLWAPSGAGVWLSEDDGATWRRVLEGVSTQAIAMHPARPAVVYAGGERLHRSEDGGQTWLEVAHPPWPEGAQVDGLVIDPWDPDRITVGLNGAEQLLAEWDVLRGGVWTSPDGGTTWEDLGAELPNDHAYGGLAVVPSTDGTSRLYIGTYGGGVWSQAVE